MVVRHRTLAQATEVVGVNKRSQKWSQQKGNRLLSLWFFNLSGEIWCRGEALELFKYKQFINSLELAEK